MDKRLAILHANCQGEPLAAALLTSPDFARAFAPRVYVNYTRQEIGEAELAACELFLYQHLGPEWGELSSASLLAKLPAGCPSLCLPNMFFKGPWPLWSGAPGFDYRDIFLDKLLDLGLPRQDILHLYLDTPLTKKFDLAALLVETFAKEREREAHTPFQYVDCIEEHWRAEPLFYTVNHPGSRLIFRTAKALLRELGMAPPGRTQLEALDPTAGSGYTDFALPIHPQVAAFHGLAYAGADTLYPAYGKTKTFAQYAAAYVDCRLAGIDDFIGYLHLR